MKPRTTRSAHLRVLTSTAAVALATVILSGCATATVQATPARSDPVTPPTVTAAAVTLLNTPAVGKTITQKTDTTGAAGASSSRFIGGGEAYTLLVKHAADNSWVCTSGEAFTVIPGPDTTVVGPGLTRDASTTCSTPEGLTVTMTKAYPEDAPAAHNPPREGATVIVTDAPAPAAAPADPETTVQREELTVWANEQLTKAKLSDKYSVYCGIGAVPDSQQLNSCLMTKADGGTYPAFVTLHETTASATHTPQVLMGMRPAEFTRS